MNVQKITQGVLKCFDLVNKVFLTKFYHIFYAKCHYLTFCLCFRFLGEVIKTGHNVYHENLRIAPKGMIKEMIKTFGPDFQQLLDLPGVHSIKYLVNIRNSVD